jgi:hypothetical protein
MLSIYGMNMGLDVTSNQRLTTAREIRHDEEEAARAKAEQALDQSVEQTVEPTSSKKAELQRRVRLLARLSPWIPKKKPVSLLNVAVPPRR